MKRRGDLAIREFYEKFYKIPASTQIRVSREEFEKAYEEVPSKLVESLERAKENIEHFHREQLPKKLWMCEVEPGVYVGQTWKPIDSVGVYIPGGKAPYPSTALMTTIPAKVVGVPKIIACTPPSRGYNVNPSILVALDIVGVKEVYRVGGAHAIAAMAYGTETIPRVEKIVGPGGIWASVAKLIVQCDVAIDFIAGPTEIIIIADETANPKLIALDLLAQAEHDQYASAILLTPSRKVALKVKEFMENLASKSPRREILTKSLTNNCLILIVKDLDEAIEFTNEYAPEHLEVIVNTDSEVVLSKIKNAGSISIGTYTPAALGDYVVGTNHVLPTSGWARRRGGLGVLDYMKIIDVQYVTPQGFKRIAGDAITIADFEGFFGHALSIGERLRELSRG